MQFAGESLVNVSFYFIRFRITLFISAKGSIQESLSLYGKSFHPYRIPALDKYLLRDQQWIFLSA
jgi:hypothetical protein